MALVYKSPAQARFWTNATEPDMTHNVQVATLSSLCKCDNVITTMAISLLDDRTYCARSAFTHLGALSKAIRLFIAASQGVSNVPYWHFRPSPTVLLQFERFWGSGYAHSINCPGFLLTPDLHVHCLSLTVLSYLAGSRCVSAHPSNPDTRTITAREATALSSGKNTLKTPKTWLCYNNNKAMIFELYAD